MELSIVIPAYREAHKISADVRAAADFLVRAGITGEVIIADDGSPDGTAAAARRTPIPPGVELRVLELEHRGKGSALRHGMREARGDYVMFADSGVCVPFDDCLPALDMLRRGDCDIANGSRKLPDSVITRPQSLYRRILSRLFRGVVRRYMRIPRFSDTQCGFKIYRGDVARKLYIACVTDGFMFDLEVIARALAAGYRIAEFPVHWTCDRDSRLKPSREMLHTFAELHAIKRQLASEPPTQPADRP